MKKTACSSGAARADTTSRPTRSTSQVPGTHRSSHCSIHQAPYHLSILQGGQPRVNRPPMGNSVFAASRGDRPREPVHASSSRCFFVDMVRAALERAGRRIAVCDTGSGDDLGVTKADTPSNHCQLRRGDPSPRRCDLPGHSRADAAPMGSFYCCRTPRTPSPRHPRGIGDRALDRADLSPPASSACSREPHAHRIWDHLPRRDRRMEPDKQRGSRVRRHRPRDRFACRYATEPPNPPDLP